MARAERIPLTTTDGASIRLLGLVEAEYGLLIYIGLEEKDRCGMWDCWTRDFNPPFSPGQVLRAKMRFGGVALGREPGRAALRRVCPSRAIPPTPENIMSTNDKNEKNTCL